MGLGSLRDALSDALFPGTSYLQTRLRYVLFVPWGPFSGKQDATFADRFGGSATVRCLLVGAGGVPLNEFLTVPAATWFEEG